MRRGVVVPASAARGGYRQPMREEVPLPRLEGSAAKVGLRELLERRG
jgi:hypothetical protein